MSEPDPDTRSHRRRSVKGRVAFGVMVVLLLATSGLCFYLYRQYAQASNTAKAQQDRILKTISSVLALPQEDPTPFTVADKNKLANQALAARVQNGDTLFVYPAAKRILVYRPSVAKAVDLITIGDTSLRTK